MRFAVVTALALSTAAMAQETPSAPPAATAPAEPVKEKKVCRSEAQLGSIMNKRTCHTRAEWASIDAANRANVERMQDQNRNTAPRN